MSDDVEVQLNKDEHHCLACQARVTSVSAAGLNQPCGHNAGTLVRRKAGGS